MGKRKRKMRSPKYAVKCAAMRKGLLGSSDENIVEATPASTLQVEIVETPKENFETLENVVSFSEDIKKEENTQVESTGNTKKKSTSTVKKSQKDAKMTPIPTSSQNSKRKAATASSKRRVKQRSRKKTDSKKI